MVGTLGQKEKQVPIEGKVGKTTRGRPRKQLVHAVIEDIRRTELDWENAIPTNSIVLAQMGQFLLVGVTCK